jgi:glutathione S-transferase
MLFGLVPESPVILDYVARVTQRAAALKIAGQDAALVAEHEKALA